MEIYELKLKEIVRLLNLEVVVKGKGLEEEVRGGYVSDMLSDVMANSQAGNIWITLQVHENIVAIATLKELAGIVVIGDRKPSEMTIKKAENENVTILNTSLSAFELSGKLYKLGIHGS